MSNVISHYDLFRFQHERYFLITNRIIKCYGTSFLAFCFHLHRQRRHTHNSLLNADIVRCMILLPMISSLHHPQHCLSFRCCRCLFVSIYLFNSTIAQLMKVVYDYVRRPFSQVSRRSGMLYRTWTVYVYTLWLSSYMLWYSILRFDAIFWSMAMKCVK